MKTVSGQQHPAEFVNLMVQGRRGGERIHAGAGGEGGWEAGGRGGGKNLRAGGGGGEEVGGGGGGGGGGEKAGRGCQEGQGERGEGN